MAEARSGGEEEEDCSDPPRISSNVLRDSCDDRTSYPTPRAAEWWVAPAEVGKAGKN